MNMSLINMSILWLAIFIFIHYFYKYFKFKVKQSILYALSSAFCLSVFIMCVKFSLDPLLGWGPAKTWDKLPYGTYPIWMFGFFSLAFGLSFLAKSIEYSKQNN